MKTLFIIFITALIVGCASTPQSATDFTVQIRNTKNVEEHIPVKLHFPKDQSPNKPAVILMGGCDGSLSHGARELLSLLLKNGVLVAELQSITSKRGPSCGFVPTVNGRQRSEEAYKTRDVLVARGLTSEDNVGLLGFSHGGWAIANAMFGDTSSIYTEVKYSSLNKKPFAAAVAFYPYCDKLDSTHFKLITPTLMFGGSSDTWTPPSQCELIADLSVKVSDPTIPLQIKIYEGATHSFDNNKPTRERDTWKGITSMSYDHAATRDSIRRTMAWFDLYLKK